MKAGFIVLILLLASVAAIGGVYFAQHARDQRHEVVMLSSGGDPDRGKAAIVREGCAACHHIPGIQPEGGRVGPDLGGIGERLYLAGMTTHASDHLVKWIRNAQQFAPHSVMPPFPISETEAKDIAAYLETLKQQ